MPPITKASTNGINKTGSCIWQLLIGLLRERITGLLESMFNLVVGERWLAIVPFRELLLERVSETIPSALHMADHSLGDATNTCLAELRGLDIVAILAHTIRIQGNSRLIFAPFRSAS